MSKILKKWKVVVECLTKDEYKWEFLAKYAEQHAIFESTSKTMTHQQDLIVGKDTVINSNLLPMALKILSQLNLEKCFLTKNPENICTYTV